MWYALMMKPNNGHPRSAGGEVGFYLCSWDYFNGGKPVNHGLIGTPVRRAPVFCDGWVRDNVFYGADTGIDSTIENMEKLDGAWSGLLDLVEEVNPDSFELLNKIINKVDPDGDVFGTGDDAGIAQNGIVRFFQKVSTWFSNIGTWFKNLFSFDFLKR